MHTMTPQRGDPLIDRALEFATQAHDGQVRKGSGKPYISHPARVAARIARLPGAESWWIAAAVLHDTIEDCAVTYETLRREFGEQVADLVAELTNPSKQHPELSRADKKAMDRAHITRCSREAKIIKLADRADNLTEGTANMPANWLRTYIGETKALAEVLRGANAILEQELADAILAAEERIHAAP